MISKGKHSICPSDADVPWLRHKRWICLQHWENSIHPLCRFSSPASASNQGAPAGGDGVLGVWVAPVTSCWWDVQMLALPMQWWIHIAQQSTQLWWFMGSRKTYSYLQGKNCRASGFKALTSVELQVQILRGSNKVFLPLRRMECHAVNCLWFSLLDAVLLLKCIMTNLGFLQNK